MAAIPQNLLKVANKITLNKPQKLHNANRQRQSTRLNRIGLENTSAQIVKHKNALKKVVSIEKRPEVVDLRKRIWDWQADTMISKQVHSVLMTLIERKARFIVAIRATNKTAKAVTKAAY